MPYSENINQAALQFVRELRQQQKEREMIEDARALKIPASGDRNGSERLHENPEAI